MDKDKNHTRSQFICQKSDINRILCPKIFSKESEAMCRELESNREDAEKLPNQSNGLLRSSNPPGTDHDLLGDDHLRENDLLCTDRYGGTSGSSFSMQID